MLHKLSRLTLTSVAVVAAGIGLLSTAAAAAPLTPGAASSGSVTVSPTTGNSETVMTVLPPSPSFCPGDSATQQYRWQTFLTSAGVDDATLTYDSNGPVLQANAPAGAIAYPLFETGAQAPIVNKNTAVGTGQIVGQLPSDLTVFSPGDLPAGAYNIGYACTKLGVTEKYWSSPITITVDAVNGGAGQIDFSTVVTPPDVPEAPLAILLPISAVALLGGAGLVIRRRRVSALAA